MNPRKTDEELTPEDKRFLKALELCAEHEDSLITSIAILKHLMDELVCKCPQCVAHHNMMAVGCAVMLSELAVSTSTNVMNLKPKVDQRLALLTAPVTS